MLFIKTIETFQILFFFFCVWPFRFLVCGLWLGIPIVQSHWVSIGCVLGDQRFRAHGDIVSLHKGTPIYTPKNTVILIIGTPRKGIPILFGTHPHPHYGLFAHQASKAVILPALQAQPTSKFEWLIARLVAANLNPRLNPKP